MGLRPLKHGTQIGQLSLKLKGLARIEKEPEPARLRPVPPLLIFSVEIFRWPSFSAHVGGHPPTPA